MLSARLVRLIEEHAEDLTRGVLEQLATHPRTSAYHRLSQADLHSRVYDVYHNLGRWVGESSEAQVEATYGALGRRRRQEGIPLSQVVFALILTKEHLLRYVRGSGAVDSAAALYQEEELNIMVGHFFDKAVYHVVRGYEEAG